MSRLLKTSWVVTICVIAFSFHAASQSKSPREIVEEIFEKASLKKTAKSAKLQSEINRHFDFEHMGRSVLGKNHARLSAADRKWFVATLKKIIGKSVYPNALEFFSGVEISYEKVKKKKATASLLSTLEKKGEETEVLYHFQKRGSAWKLVDVSIDEESWVENIRDEVQGILKKEKWPGLKRRLKARLAKLDKKKE